MLDRVNNPACNAAAEVGWRLAEGTATAEELAATRESLRGAWEASWEEVIHYFVAPVELWLLPRLVNVLVLLLSEPDAAARNLITPLSFVHPGDPIPLLSPEETSGCCPLIRDIFGIHRGMMAPPNWQPFWVTETVRLLAKQMYESREFGAMPILADALQDDGRDNPDILSHCRDATATHVRGCWVVDLVLGKE